MTDLLSLTQQLENVVFLKSDGLPNNNTASTAPFYEDSAGINFGYGINIPKGNTTAIVALRNTVEQILLGASVPQASRDVLNQYVAAK